MIDYYINLIMNFKWPHFENIHRYVANSLEPDSIFEQDVCITEKLDGSNLTIHLEKVEKEWIIVQLMGRNCPIWNQQMKNSYINLSYGSVGNMGCLVNHMKDFAIKIAEKINTNVIFISGEVLKANGKIATWHPFGYTVEIGENKELCDKRNENNINYLTYDTHKLFIECSEDVNPEELKEKLLSTTSHLVFPPPILFVGKLSQGINYLYESMLKLTKDFEGSFIIFEKIPWGFKWKTGLHDEQPQVFSVDKIKFKLQESIDVYTKLIQVFNNKTIKEIKIVNSKKKVEKPLSEAKILSNDIITAYKRELTKNESFIHIPENEREIIISSFSRLVIDEIITKYSESNLSLPYSKELLEKQTMLIVKSLINKELYKK